MKSIFSTSRNIRLATSLTLGLCLGHLAWSKPSIQSIEVTPTPLLLNRSFTITATGLPDVTSATASVDFRPGKEQTLDLSLTNNGTSWTASGLIPSDLDIKHPDNARAKIKVTLFDAAGKKAQADLQVEIDAPTVTAVFAGGILTVSGDDSDNTLVVSRDTAGSLFVNSGAVPVTGGTPTVSNTTLIQIFGFGGNDVLTVDDSNGPMPPANLVGGDGDDTLTGSASDDILDGGPGNDTLIGRGGNDTLLGGPGNDILIGGQGTDQLIGGDGDDQIIWNPGDGSDVVEGGAGNDTLVFNGANIAETVDLSANGPRFRFFRNVANITMDCDGIEQVVFRALGGADQVTVNDLTGTAVTNVLVDLSSTAGTGDGAADTVIVNGTTNNDNITITGSPTNATVLGLSAAVTVVGAEPALDKLIINGLAGDDVIDASGVSSNAISLTLNGGAGNDILIGGAGNDTLIGGQGNDTAFGGAGDDTFIWNPGDGSDVFEGEGGRDTMLFNGANINETVDISANGRRLRFFRNVANITMDCDGVEVVQFNALGGADNITVNDLTGTAVTEVDLDLASPARSGIGDGAADTVIVNGTQTNDVVTVTGTPATGVTVLGLSATVNIVGSEPTLDQLLVNLLGGDDAFVASDLQAGVINLTVDGGAGNDVIIGSQGADTLLGWEGDDILNGGPGLDVLDGGPGNNILIQD